MEVLVLDSDHRYGLRLGPLFMRGWLKCGIRLDSHSRCIQIALPNYTRIQEPAVDHCGLFACWHGVASTAACLRSLHVAGYLGPCACALGQDDKRFLTPRCAPSLPVRVEWRLWFRCGLSLGSVCGFALRPVCWSCTFMLVCFKSLAHVVLFFYSGLF